MSFTLPFKHSDPAHWQSVTFTLALILYALTGSPTPDAIGLPEIIMALLLMVSITIPSLSKLPVQASAFLFYGLSIPLLSGVASGHDPASILRDLIPFGFLLMPLLYRSTRNLHWLVVGIGLAFAARSLLPYKERLYHPQLWLGQPPADLLYLANSPEVLFAALFLIGTGGYLIWSRRSLVGGVLLSALASLPLLAMAVMMQRAGVGCVILAAFIWSLIGFWLRPAWMVVTAGLALCVLLPLMPLIETIMGTLVLKTELVGLNSRVQEWGVVLDRVSVSPWSLLFGQGWGLTFENPAVGNLPVNYTHSLISALLLKTGLIGVGLAAAYLWILIKHSVPQLWWQPILMLALAAPIGIGLLFYASYKSLGFGLMLLLLGNRDFYRKLEKNQRDMA